MNSVAQVSLPIARDIEFDYTVPLDQRVFVGSRVFVSFGNRKVVGIVTALSDVSDRDKLKPLSEVLDRTPVLTGEHIAFARKLKEKYPYPLGEFLSMMLPQRLKKAIVCDVEQAAPYAGETATEFFRAPDFKSRYLSWREKVKAVIAAGHSAVICFPTMAYLEEALAHIRPDFPSLAVISSAHKDVQLFADWQRSRKNSLIVCTRMGLFLYPADLALIVMEDENNHSYFQEEKPFYHLFDVAKLLAQHKQIPLILSADFPSLATYKAIKENEVTLRDSPDAGKIEVVGMGLHDKRVATSPLLMEFLRNSFKNQKRVAVIWNKKGYASVVSCTVCGHVYKCDACSAALKVFSSSDKGICPYCSKRYDLPKICTVCKKGYLKTSGAGVERVESIIRKNFPGVESAVFAGKETNAQIVFFTAQIIAGLYAPREYDRGFVLDGDALLWRLDFKATFEAYLYLKKLSLMFKEELVVFTSHFDHYLFKNLAGAWREFYERELEFRGRLKLPPYGSLVRVVLRGAVENALLKNAEAVYNKLQQKGLDVYGPFKEYPFKLRGNYRYGLVVKGEGKDLPHAVAAELEKMRLSSVKKAIIVD